MKNIHSYKADLSSLNSLLSSRPRDVVPFEAVLQKVMARYELDAEMREKYPAAAAKRYRDFINIGRSLDFGSVDLERDMQ
jgi:hypothetical protein